MMKRRTILQGLAVAAVLAGSVGEGEALAQGNEPLALKGYDPVAYFTDGKPTEGTTTYELTFDGQRYRFANARHRELFKTNPDKYAPQFGGLCAMNLSRGVRRASSTSAWSGSTEPGARSALRASSSRHSTSSSATPRALSLRRPRRGRRS